MQLLEKEKPTEEVSAEKLKEVYSFTVEQTEKVKVTEKELRKTEEGEEEVEVTKEIDQAVPYRIIIKQITYSLISF